MHVQEDEMIETFFSHSVKLPIVQLLTTKIVRFLI